MTNEINLYSKEQVDDLLLNKEDVGTSYTKAETDALLDEKEDVGTSYTKVETDALLAGKEDAGLSYTKAQVDGLLADKASYGEVVELEGSSDIGSDLRPIKIVGGVAFAVANPIIDTETEQTINAKKTFAVNAKSAAPASGAVDNSLVNANWASQTGTGRPNNLMHETGVESFMADKAFGSATNPDVASLIIWSSGAYRRLRFRSSVDDKTATPETAVRYGLLNYSDKNDQTVCNFQLEHKTTGGYKLTVTLKKSDGTDQTFVIGETS